MRLRTKHYFSVITLILSGLLLIGCKSKPNKPSNILRSNNLTNFIEDMECLSDSLNNKFGSPGSAIVVVHDSTVVLIKPYGLRTLKDTLLVNECTTFRLGSVSKGFASILMAKLIQKNLFGWNDKVQQYIPNFYLKDTAQSSRVTIQHLMSHSTGLMKHSYTDLIETGMPIQEIIPKLPTVNLYAKEGELFAYQNLTYAISQEIIKTKTDTTYQYWLQKEILDPLNMQHYSYTKNDFRATENKALPHRHRTKTTYRQVRLNGKYYNAVTAGGLNVSINDMGEWLKLLLGNKPNVISTDALNQVFQPLLKTSGVHGFDRWKGVEESYYGLGWRILKYNNRDIVYHGGSVNEYRSEVVVDRKNKLAMCMLFNANCRQASLAVPTFLNLVDKHFQE